jgi:hypothetical protein
VKSEIADRKIPVHCWDLFKSHRVNGICDLDGIAYRMNSGQVFEPEVV